MTMPLDDAVAVAERVTAGAVSAVEMVAAAFDRIERYDATYGAVIHTRYDAALSEARQRDLRGLPLAGVPLLLKDLGCEMEGEPCHQGNRRMRDQGVTSRETLPLVQRLIDAGCIVIGRTCVPEFGLACTSESLAHGPTSNPRDTGRVAGGSSGGAAAAVALGYAPLAIGNDGAGSVRMPAAYCGVFGFKPSRGVLAGAAATGGPLEAHMVHGPLARSVRDLRRAIESMAHQRPVPQQTGSLRIAIIDDAPMYLVDDGSRQALGETTARLRSLGHQVVHETPPGWYDARYFEAFVDTLAPTVTVGLEALYPDGDERNTRDGVEPIAAYWAARGRTLTAGDHVRARAVVADYAERWARWFASVDVLVSPVATMPPPPLGWFAGADGVARSLEHIRLNPQANSAGFPAVSLPMVKVGGWPVSVQLLAATGRDGLLLELADRLEPLEPPALPDP